MFSFCYEILKHDGTQSDDGRANSSIPSCRIFILKVVVRFINQTLFLHSSLVLIDVVSSMINIESGIKLNNYAG